MAIRELNLADTIQLGFFRNLALTTTSESYNKPERRQAKRYSLQLTAMATPFDAEYQPTGDPFPVLTRDISSSGIGLIHSRPLDMKYIGLDLKGPENQELSLVVEVLRCNRFLCGNDEPSPSDAGCTYYQSGGRFVSVSS